MDRIRHPAHGAALLLCLAFGTADAASPEPLRLDLVGEPGHLRITNHSDHAVEIARAVTIEQQDDSGAWHKVETEFNAVAACSVRPSEAREVRLGPHVVMDLAPWRGESCSGQCQMACRANISYLPGRFRFVVKLLPGGQTVASPGFHMGPG